MTKIFQNLGGVLTTGIKFFDFFIKKIDFLCIMVKLKKLKLFSLLQNKKFRCLF